MATFRKRNGKWQVQIRRIGAAPISKTFLQRKDAEKWATLQERRLDELVSLGLKESTFCELTLGELLARYREQVVPLKRGATVEAYIVRAMERTDMASLLARTVGPDHFITYRDRRLGSVKPSTVARELGLAHHVYETARKEWGFASLSNPLRDVPKPKLSGGRTRRLNSSEEAKVRSEAARCRNILVLPVMEVALATAMRLGEIVSARWDDYDPTARVLLLPQTKNGKPRTVPLSRRAVEVIDSQRPATSDRIFPTTVEAIKRGWIRLTRRAGVSDLHFHDLRHEAISRLVEAGFDLPSVMMFSGHSDHRMLLRYTHLNARSLVSRLDSLTDG